MKTDSADVGRAVRATRSTMTLSSTHMTSASEGTFDTFVGAVCFGVTERCQSDACH